MNTKNSVFFPIIENKRAIFPLLFLAFFFRGCDSGPNFRGTIYPESAPAPDFTLTDQSGREFSFSDHNSKINLIFFGYIYCPDVCPMTLSTWANVQKALKGEAENVQFLFITVDPERDTAAKLKKHLAIFSDSFVGLWGSPDEMVFVYDDYGVIAEKEFISDSASGYLVAHSARIYVIDQTGKMRLSHNFDVSKEDLLHDIKELIKYPKGAKDD